MQFPDYLLVVATLASGATAALNHYRFRYWRHLAKRLQRQQNLHLQIIFDLQQKQQQP